jgi:hypothetical protein
MTLQIWLIIQKKHKLELTTLETKSSVLSSEHNPVSKDVRYAKIRYAGPQHSGIFC